MNSKNALATNSGANIINEESISGILPGNPGNISDSDFDVAGAVQRCFAVYTHPHTHTHSLTHTHTHTHTLAHSHPHTLTLSRR